MVEREIIWAVHDFEAENPDEVSFFSGEAIIVVEKDDAYSDGWWQGTNERGETGLFPFSYATYDKELALGAKLLAAGSKPDSNGPTSTQAPGDTTEDSTMAHIDGALTELRASDSRSAENLGRRASMTSQRTADMSIAETDADGDNDEYQPAARSALAANAQKSLDSATEKQRAEDERLRSHAQKMFQEEESRQRELLLQKEQEHNAAAASGKLNSRQSMKPPIPAMQDVEMSDESESEEEGPSIVTNDATHHSPLFGANQNNGQSDARSGSHLSADNSGDASRSALGAAAAAAGGRSLSPIHSVQGHSPIEHSTPTRATAPLAPETNGRQASQSYDRGSVDSSHRTSMVDSLPTHSGSGPGTAATSVVGQPDTPRSSSATPAASTGGNARPAGPGGDPHDWSVDQVVDWARSKGWDEAAVVSKFAEHEISGDVLMEMDVNILKEIDIVAFGKRFPVAQAIKELKNPGGPLSAGVSPGGYSAGPSPGGYSQQPSPAQLLPSSAHSSFGSSVPRDSISAPGSAGLPYGSGPYGTAQILSAPVPPPLRTQLSEGNFAQSNVQRNSDPSMGGAYGGSSSGGPPSRPGSNVPQFPLDGQYGDPNRSRDLTGATSISDNGGDLTPSFNTPPQSTEVLSESGGSIDRKRLSASGSSAAARNRSGNGSIAEDDSIAGLVASSPRKRENSAGRAVGTGERTSFFGIGPRTRKPPPRVAAPAAAGADDENRKGTLSRLGFGNRMSKVGNNSSDGKSTSPSISDLRNQISLPTSSPTYNSMGDTARRNRVSTASGGGGGGGGGVGGASVGGLSSPGGPASGAFAGSFGHAKQSSVGSVPVREASLGATTEQKASGDGQSGPVMARIRPVDLEGWMKKKGERYNSWKPRYLALKGPDLVLLRDPSAEKIKGYVSMKGYKVIADENTNPGKYGFKILHETEKPHYFSSDDPVLVREWMKALMKSTIGRDHSFPVISSYNNATISLKEAQRMNPPPRPPSPTSRARAQRARARENPDQLTAKDAAVLMGLGGPNVGAPPPK